MNKQNEMMDFIWLLNAAAHSAFETKGLYLEFLRRQQDFCAMRQSCEAHPPRSAYLEEEISRNLESLQGLQKTIGEMLAALLLPGMECADNEG